jgi:hypothetical protein
MARGQKDGSDPDEGPILSPDELDITDDEHVAELDDGRYVVSPSGPIDTSVGSAASSGSSAGDAGTTDGASQGDAGTDEPTGQQSPDAADAGSPGRSQVEIDEEVVHSFLSDRFDASDARYGFDVTAKFDSSVRQRHMVSNDVVTIFESLILWYAQQIDSSTPVEEILGILLMESNVPIRYPPASLQTMLDAAGLSPDDSIADLIEAVGEDDGLRL